MLFPNLLVVFVVSISLFDSVHGQPSFEDDREGWFTSMEQTFGELAISPDKYTTYAIQEGLKSLPGLQSAMSERFDQYTRLIGDVAARDDRFVDVDLSRGWPWEEFKTDISRVADAAKDIQITTVSVYRIPTDSVDSPQVYLGKRSDVIAWNDRIHLPAEQLFPSLEEILQRVLRRIREALEVAKTELDHVIQDGSTQAEEVLRKIQNFVSVQIELLPAEVRIAVGVFNDFRHEHPYMVAAASVALAIFSSEVILPWMFLRVLGMFGFGELGPLAGSWAAAVQSVIYGGRTKGLFSILQHVTMSAKRFWPARVFLDLAAIGTGITVWSGEMVRDQVSLWYPDMVLDLHRAMQSDGEVVVDSWMQELGRRCEMAGIPEAQWLDVAIQSITKAVQEMTKASSV